MSILFFFKFFQGEDFEKLLNVRIQLSESVYMLTVEFWGHTIKAVRIAKDSALVEEAKNLVEALKVYSWLSLIDAEIIYASPIWVTCCKGNEVDCCKEPSVWK